MLGKSQKFQRLAATRIEECTSSISESDIERIKNQGGDYEKWF